ncbi:hypothetical protein HYH03_015460 [Edaphochlamys debaryana]|uniref:Calponin-homology (CH) domain-containing protein n=1 Tax=Edaphochlamys debaryana TaxID=47281 RepID=A0A836BR90_9CHLO|nr:hypothetical protein HYH03_015460 [Edaphochlamys debaryana]|eukprot:KAG2485877.1 hypothetical protein HYH03_015460 [Edaphochlamys debaryana]
MATEDGFTAEELVQACNKVLVYAGLVAKVATVEEVRVVCSSTSVFVAALEGFLQHRLEGIHRKPQTPEERAENNDRVVEALGQILSCDLSHISGRRVVEGSTEDISNLLELLSALCQGQPLVGPPLPEPKASEAGATGPSQAQAHASVGGAVASPGPSQALGATGSPSSPSRRRPASPLFDVPDDEEAAARRPDDDSWLYLHSRDLNGLSTSPTRRLSPRRQDSDDLFEEEEREARRQAQRQQQERQRSMQGGLDGRRPLSPIPEVSREGHESTRGSRETPEVAQPFRVPSDLAGYGGGHYYPRPAWPHDPHRHPAGADAYAGGRPGRGRDGRDEDEESLLKQAISQAEATLRDMGLEYEDFYYDDQDQDLERGRGRKHGTGGGRLGAAPAATQQARRNVRAAPWPDGAVGSMAQHKAFLRRARGVLEGEPGSSLDAGSQRSSLPFGSEASAGSGRLPRAVKKALKQGGPAGLVAAAAVGRRKVRVNGAIDATGRTGGPLLQPLPGTTVPPAPTAKGRRLVQRCAGAYKAVLPVAEQKRLPKQLPRGGRSYDGHSYDGHSYDGRSEDTEGLSMTQLELGEPGHPGMHLSSELASKLRYVYGLALGDPKQRAARAAAQQLRLADEQSRRAQRRELVERLASARARREAALRLNADRMRQQNAEYDKRIETLKLQRAAAEWHDQQKSAQMRRALQAELALREAFLEVIEGEKEVLLEERRTTKQAARFPAYQRAMGKAEAEYLQLYNTLESLLAAERQQRVRANREALLATKQEAKLASAVVHDRMQELLGRIARDEEAVLQRTSVATHPQSRQAMVAQIRRLLGLSGAQGY